MKLPAMSWLLRSRRPQLVDGGPFLDDVRRAILDAQSYALSHGGMIRLVGVTAQRDVLIEFEGACKGCPLTELTLRLHVEKRLREQVPGIRKVKVARG